jgi:hypothetical protein
MTRSPDGGTATGKVIKLGRKRGTRNWRTIERECAGAAAARTITAALGENAFPGDAHALLMSVYRDVRQPVGVRIDAARAAIGYEKPRLTAVEAKVEGPPQRAPAGTASAARKGGRRPIRNDIERRCRHCQVGKQGGRGERAPAAADAER